MRNGPRGLNGPGYGAKLCSAMQDHTTPITHELAAALLPRRPSDGHKGTFGRVLLLAGAEGYTGAAKLAALAAARSGAGLVTVGIPAPLSSAMAAALWEVMYTPLPATDAASIADTALAPALEAAQASDAVVLGPGLTRHPRTAYFTRAFVEACPAPLVIDADGLNNLGARPQVLKARRAATALTPHPGEMARLLNVSVGAVMKDTEAAAADFAKAFSCVLVLKSHHTVIAEPGGAVYLHATANSGLARGGAGDVLAGLLGGLLAQGMTPGPAAALAVYVHGLAGRAAAERRTERGMIATDVLDAIPEAWKALENGIPCQNG
jgi:ADP-dependent NAD(P)H-hydrate dehydratase / NAD(P)H-hydrate epimerase